MRSRRTRTIVSILAAGLVVALGLAGWRGGASPARSPGRLVGAAVANPVVTARPSAPASPSASAPARDASPPAAGAPTTGAVFDLATLARRPAPARAADRDRFRTTDTFTADDLAHPERYFDAAEHVPELQRDEERHDALAYFLAYRAKLERDLRSGRRDGGQRADIQTITGRYDAAIARLRQVEPTARP